MTKGPDETSGLDTRTTCFLIIWKSWKSLLWLRLGEFRYSVCEKVNPMTDNGESDHWYEQSEETTWYWCDQDCADLGHPSVPHCPHILAPGLVLCQNCAWPCPLLASPWLMVHCHHGCLANANVLFSIWHQVSPSLWLSINNNLPFAVHTMDWTKEVKQNFAKKEFTASSYLH